MIKKILEIDLKNRSNKIFGIGLAKTGTSSLNKALEILGYRSIHFCRHLNEINIEGSPISRLSTVLNQCSWDAITNSGEHIYPLTDKEFPNSKFILTIRNKEPWLESVKNHFLDRPFFEKNRIELPRVLSMVHALGHVVYNEEYLPIVYDNHLRNAKHYFKDRKQDLLIIDICGGQGWEKLCPFLDRDVLNIPFPYKNITLKK
jgi:hypothetical protein